MESVNRIKFLVTYIEQDLSYICNTTTKVKKANKQLYLLRMHRKIIYKGTFNDL